MGRLLFVSDFDGALTKKDTNAYLFERIDPKIDTMLEAAYARRESNIRMLSAAGALGLVERAGGTITPGKGGFSRVRWREKADGRRADLPMELLPDAVAGRAAKYYAGHRTPPKKFLSSLIPSDEFLQKPFEGAKNAGEAYQNQLGWLHRKEIEEVGFHEFIDGMLLHLVKKDDIVEASREIGGMHMQPGVDALFETLRKLGAHIAICSYSYIDTVRIALDDVIRVSQKYRNGRVHYVANSITYCDGNGGRISGIERIGNKWNALDSCLYYAGFRPDGHGIYKASFGYDDGIYNLKDMVSRFTVSIMLVADRSKTVEGIVQEVGSMTRQKKISVCFENRDWSLEHVAEWVVEDARRMGHGTAISKGGRSPKDVS